MASTPFRNEEAVMTLDPIARPIAAVLAFFYGLIPNYAVSIILLTVCVMIILTPLTIKQTRSMLVMQKLQPELKKLQDQHKNDRQALNEAVMALYKEHNASPLGGCLPMLLPFPVFLALFKVLEGLSRQVHGHSVPKYLSPHTSMYKAIVAAGGELNSFGMNLAKSALNVSGSFWTKLPYFILLLIMVGTQYYQQRQMTSRNPTAAQGPQANMMKFIPVFFGVISIRFPAGVVLYWTVSNAIRIFQQWAMYQFDPKVKALVTQDIKEVEAKTREIDEHGSKPSKPRLRDLLTGAAATDKGLAPKTPPAKPAPGAKSPPAKPPRSGKPPGAAAKTPPNKATSKPPRTGQPPGGAKPPPKSSSIPRPPRTGKPPADARPPANDATTPKTNGSTNRGTPTPVDKKPVVPVEKKPAAANGNSDEGTDAKPAPTASKGDTKDTNGTPPPRTGGGRTGGGRTGGSSARPNNRDKRNQGQ
jgi:YidC/Oxa1 family membrane protein insertase